MTITPPQRYACLINNQNDHGALVAQLKGDTFLTRLLVYGAVPCTWIESTDPALVALASQLPMGQCVSVGDRHQLIKDWFDCIDVFRVGVRPEHLDALAAATTLGEFQAARAAIVADTQYPPAP